MFYINTWRRRLIGVLPIVVLMSLVWSVGHPLLTQTPLTHDHPTHLFKAWHFYEKMLPELRLRGFSHYWVFGYPAGELVPIGEEIWVALFRAFTFEQLNWLKTYSLSLFGLLALIAFSAYIFASHYFGRTAGLISGAMVLLDPGGWAQAGWEWFMVFGVWPNSLGLSLILLAVVALEKLANGFSVRRFVVAVALLTSSLLAHQVTVVFLPIFLALMVIDRWVRRDLRAQSVKNMFLAVFLGVGFSAFYLVPMLARSELTIDLGVAGVPMRDVGIRLMEGRYFQSMWALLVPIGFVGAFVALRRRLPGAVFLSLGTGVFTLASTDFPFSALHLETVLPFITKVESARVLLGAKILWFPLTAYGLSLPLLALWQVILPILESPRTGILRINPRWALAWASGFLLIVPYLSTATDWLYQRQFKKELPPENVAFFQDLKQVWAKTKQLRASQDGLYRIAYDLPMHDHIATLAPVFDDTWIYKVGYTPSQAFREFPMEFDLPLFKKLMVKYVVSTRKLSRSQFLPIETFGALHLYEMSQYEGRPFELIGSGEAQLLEFSPERIRIKLSGTSTDSRLQLFVSHIDHWQAKIGQKKLPIIQATVHGAEDPFLMEAPASDGILEFKYRPALVDLVGRWWTIASALALGAWCALRWRNKRNLSTPQRMTPLKAWAFRLATDSKLRLSLRSRLALLVVAFCITGTWTAARVASRTAFIAKDSLFLGMSQSALTVDGQPCKSDAPLSFRCGTQILKAERVSGLYGTHLCLTAPSAKTLTVNTRRRLGAAVRGRYDVKGGSGQIRVQVDENTIGRVVTRKRDQGQQFLRFDTRPYAGQEHQLTIQMQGAPLYCFDFSIEQ